MSDLIDLDRFEPDDVERVRTWVNFCVDVMEVEPERNYTQLSAALENLTTRADVVYPQLESGEKVSMDRCHLGPNWQLGPELADLMVRLSGDVLFIGDDGPRPTGAVLQGALDQIYERLTGGGF